MDYDLTANFNEVYKELRLATKNTALAYGMGFTTTRQLKNSLEGKAMLSTKAISNLVKNFNVNPTYLFTGTGKKFLNQEPVQKFSYDVVSSTY